MQLWLSWCLLLVDQVGLELRAIHLPARINSMHHLVLVQYREDSSKKKKKTKLKPLALLLGIGQITLDFSRLNISPVAAQLFEFC